MVFALVAICRLNAWDRPKIAGLYPALGCAMALLASSGADADDRAVQRSLAKPAAETMMREVDGLRATLEYRAAGEALALRFEPLATRDIPEPALLMRDKLQHVRPLLEAFFQANDGRSYALWVGEYPELNDRLFAAGSNPGQWDAQAGPAPSRSTGISPLAHEMLADPAFYPELATVMREFGFTTTVREVENVILCSANDSGPIAIDQALPPDAETRVAPCGASIVFDIAQ